MQIIEVEQGQTLLDIALQYYGDASLVVWLIEDNEGIEFDSELTQGDTLNIRAVEQTSDVVKYYQKNNIKPNSNNGTVG